MSRFKLWESDEPLIGLAEFFPSLAEGKGLPLGWVSVWKVGGKEVKHQKVKDGWVEVPSSVPTGQNPIFHKSSYSPGSAAAAAPAVKTFSNDDEMASYLKSVKFHQPAMQAGLLKNPKFVNDMHQKFGDNWFKRYQAMQAARKGAPTAAVSPVAAEPTDAVGYAADKLGFPPDSKPAFALAQLHKFGGSKQAVSAYQAQFKIKGYGKAYHEVEAVWQAAQQKGLISVEQVDEFDVEVKFKAPPAAPKPPLTKAVAPPVVSAPSAAPVTAIDDLVTKLGYKLGSDAAVAVSFVQSNPDDLKLAASGLAGVLGLSPVVAATVVAQVHQKMVGIGAVTAPKKTKAKKPLVAPPAPAPAPAPAPVAVPVPEPEPVSPPSWSAAAAAPSIPVSVVEPPGFDFNSLTSAEFSTLQKELDFPAGSIGKLAISLLYNKGGNEVEAAAALASMYSNIDKGVAATLVTAAKNTALTWKLPPNHPSLPTGYTSATTHSDLELPVTTTKWAKKNVEKFTFDELKGVIADALPEPANPQVTQLAAHLNVFPSSSVAKVLNVWRDALKKYVNDPQSQQLSAPGSAALTLADLILSHPEASKNPKLAGKNSTDLAIELLPVVNGVIVQVKKLPFWDDDAMQSFATSSMDIDDFLPKAKARAKAIAQKGEAYLAAAPSANIEAYHASGGVTDNDNIFFGVLATHDAHAKYGDSLHAALKAAAVKYMGLEGTQASSVASGFLALAKETGFVIESPGGDEFTVGTEFTAFKWPSAAPAAVPAPVMAPPVAPAPVQPSPEPSVGSGDKKGLELPSIPKNLGELVVAGDAKKKLGGNKPKQFMKDNGGNLFLHKYDADRIRAAGGEVASNIAALVSGAGTFVPVKALKVDTQGWGTVQPMVANATGIGTNDTSTEDLKKLTKEQLAQLQRERVIDWVASNHDSKIGNFIKAANGTIVGIDKEQAFKFIGKDTLSADYSVNPSPPVYNALYTAWADKELDLDPNDVLPFIQRIEGTSDEDWTQAVQPYIDALPYGERAEKLELILARKNSVRADFEKFFTPLLKKRGELGLTGKFSFAATGPVAPKTNVPQVAAGVLAGPNIPSLATLKYNGVANIGGASEKHFYTDASGKKWLLKLAADKNSGKPQPFKVAAQAIFAKVGLAVKPSTVPMGATEYKGVPATLQPWLGDNIKSLKSVNPADLTDQQKKDVADEHVLDWLLSNHDSHPANFLAMPDGSVVGIDKEQAFKFLLPNPKLPSVTPDKLSLTYHPNTMENPPYYNRFWKDFADGNMSFDPTVMKDAVYAVSKIPDDQYVKELAAYAETAFAGDATKQSAFYAKALDRKHDLQKDFEVFITDLYKKRTKKNGSFTFFSGWVPEGGVVVAPAATAQPLPAAIPNNAAMTPDAEKFDAKKLSDAGGAFIANVLKNGTGAQKVALGNFVSDEDKMLLGVLQNWSGDHSVVSDLVTAASMALNLTVADAEEAANTFLKKAILAKLVTTGAYAGGYGFHPSVPTSAPPEAPAQVSPVSAPPPVAGPPVPPPKGSVSVPLPAGYTPPSPSQIYTAATKLNIPSKGVYRPALKALAAYNFNVSDAAAALAFASGQKFELALKRVKYVAKKIKEAGGWGALVAPVSAPAPAPAPVSVSAPAPVSAPALGIPTPSEEPSIPDAPKEAVTLKLAPNKPTAKGALGLQEVALITPETYAPPPPPPPPAKPPTPAGFTEPPDGQMWSVMTASQYKQNHVYKEKVPKNAAGEPDTSSPNIVVKLQGLSVQKAEALVKKLGVEALVTPGKSQFKEKDGKVLFLVDKAAWSSAWDAKMKKGGTEEFSHLIPIPPPEPPEVPDTTGGWKPTPKPGELKNPVATPNVEDLLTLHTSKDIGFGHGLFVDGGAVESQSVSVQRNVDLAGKEFYRFQFKLREPVWKKLKGGVPAPFVYNRTKYDENKDAWVASAKGSHATDVINGMSKWTDGDSVLHVGTDTNKFAYRGAVMADVYLNPGENLNEGLKRLLDKTHPELAAQVLKNPTKGERDLLALSALYWSVAPQQADALPESSRTVPELKQRLQALGYTDEDFGNLGFERVAMDRIVPVLKGRHKKLKAKFELMNIGIGVDTAEKVVKQLASGTIGIMQRLQHGIPCPESGNSKDASPSDDQKSGGADYVYTRVDKKSVGWPSGYGSIQMIFDLSELDRLDLYQHAGDHYGTCNPKETGYNNGGYNYANRNSLEKTSGNAFEVSFRRGISSRKLLKIQVGDDSTRQNLIDLAKKAGIFKMNGMDIEDLIIVRSGSWGAGNGLYKNHLQPAGY